MDPDAVASTLPELPEEFGNPWMANLQEIGLPAPVPWTPQTAGWYLLAALLLLGLLLLIRRWVRKWRASAYRRHALAELDRLEEGLQDETARGDSLAVLPALLKRTALAAYPRTEVARLSGEAWLAFLDGTLGSTEFTRGPGRILPDLAYSSAAAGSIPQSELGGLLSLARRWIHHHRPADRRP